MKTWKDIRTETLNLGFEKIKTYEKNKQSYVDAYNWAQGVIASTIGGVIHRIGVASDGSHRHVFDLAEMAKGRGLEYIAMAQTGVVDMQGRPVYGWALTDNRFFRLPDDFAGHRTVTVLVMPPKITTAADDNTPCPLPEKWAGIMPYLMANRLFLDDDGAKAGYYWNLYMDMRNEILARENTAYVAVSGGIDIDRWC